MSIQSLELSSLSPSLSGSPAWWKSHVCLPWPPISDFPQAVLWKASLAFLCGDALPWQPQPGAKETGERPLVRPTCPWHGRMPWRGLLLGNSPVPQVLPYCEGFHRSGKYVAVSQGTFQSPRSSLWEDMDGTFSFSAQLPTRHFTVSKLFNLLECGFSLL